MTDKIYKLRWYHRCYKNTISQKRTTTESLFLINKITLLRLTPDRRAIPRRETRSQRSFSISSSFFFLSVECSVKTVVFAVIFLRALFCFAVFSNIYTAAFSARYVYHISPFFLFLYSIIKKISVKKIPLPTNLTDYTDFLRTRYGAFAS